MDPDRDRPRSKGRQMQNKRRFASPLVRHLARRDHGVSMGSVLHGMTPTNRAKLRGEADRNGGKKEGSELAQGEQGKGGEGEKGDEEGREASARWWPREERRERRDEKEEKENGARASGRSLGPRVPRHGLVSLSSVRGQRSSSSTSHLGVLNLPSVLPTPI